MNKADEIGGGNTFLRNFIQANDEYGELDITDELNDRVDLAFLWAPHVFEKGDLAFIKEHNIRLVVRLDGVPEDSRNSGHGTSRLVESIQAAHMVIYQTKFVANTVGRLIQAKNSIVVYNGVDISVFNPHGHLSPLIDHKKLNIYVNHYRKDPNKRYEEVVEMFRMVSATSPDKYRLVLVGRYPTIWQDYRFGFFNNEDVLYLGVRSPIETAAIIRSCDVMFHPAFADPSPNSVLESLACGVPVVTNPYSGALELAKLATREPVNVSGYIPESYESWESMLAQAKILGLPDFEVIEKNFSLATMYENYYSLFNNLLQNRDGDA